MKQALFSGEDFNEGTEIHYFSNQAFINFTDFRVGSDFLYMIFCTLCIFFSGRSNTDCTVVFNIYFDAKQSLHTLYYFSSRTYNHTNLILFNFYGQQSWSILGEVFIWFGNCFIHNIEDMKSSFLSRSEEHTSELQSP